MLTFLIITIVKLKRSIDYLLRLDVRTLKTAFLNKF